MTNQSNEAAERSAHVTRGNKPAPTNWPIVQVANDVWKLRAIVELEEERDLWKQRYEELVNAIEARLRLYVSAPPPPPSP